MQLPKFTNGGGKKTPGPNVPRGDLVISPTVYFEGRWIEGAFNSIQDPFPNSTLELYVNQEVSIPAGTSLKVRIYPANGIVVYCGYDRLENTEADHYLMWTNATTYGSSRVAIENGVRVGNGCSSISDCASKGTCDYCQEICECYTGFGSGDNRRQIGSMDCTLLECPVGPLWGSLPSNATDGGHGMQTQMCSGAGLCLAETGVCECFVGFTGDACQRWTGSCGASSSCSDHGQCLTMHDLARSHEALPLSEGMGSYGDDPTNRSDTRAWDWDTLMGCVCDSSWPVGLDAGEWQQAEYRSRRPRLVRSRSRRRRGARIARGRVAATPRRADRPWTGRGDAAAATRIARGRVAATPRLRRRGDVGILHEVCRG